MEYAQSIYSYLRWIWDETSDFKTILYLIYLCAIKIKDYVIFIYEGSTHTRYDYNVYARGLCNPQDRYREVFKFSAFLTYHFNDVR